LHGTDPEGHALEGVLAPVEPVARAKDQVRVRVGVRIRVRVRVGVGVRVS
jgi:hypothetical protein